MCIGENLIKNDWVKTMQRKILILLSAFFSLLILTGCVSIFPSPIREEADNQVVDVPVYAPAVEVVAETTGPIPFAIQYLTNNIARAMYEPTGGTYIGAWLGPHTTKSNFEALTEKKHAVFARDFYIGDEFPTTWILQCIAAQAAPLIVLRLSSQQEDAFPLAELAAFAFELGNFNIPAFIVFNPLTLDTEMYPEDYVLLYRYARIIFRSHAPMSAFVWHSYDNEATAESLFYPGHDAVDWVSLGILAPQGADGFLVDIPTYLTPFYLNWQYHKPIMLLPVGVGHFSRRDYVYRVPQAAVEITRVYEILRNNFPRLGLVVYRDHGSTTPQGDDFSLTHETKLIHAYRDAIGDDHFISRVTSASEDGFAWKLSLFNGYYKDGEIYIDREVLTARGHNPIPSTTTTINERPHINVDAISGLKIAADHTRRIIYIQPGE